MKKSFLILIAIVVGVCWSVSAIATNLINENIQSWTARASYGTYTQTITAGTVDMVQCIVQPSASASGTGSIGRVQMQGADGILALPALATCGTIEFHIAAGGAGRTVKLQRYNGSTWDDLTTFTGIGTTGATYTYTLNSSTSTTLRLASPSAALYVHDIIVTDYSASTPTITLSPTTLTGFTYMEGSGPSSEQEFTVSGSNLTEDISISAPTNYEISTGTGGSFTATSPITLAQSGGTVSSTTVYVRLKTGLAVGNYNNENITASSTGADSKTVTCSGEVTVISTDCGSETFDNFGATGTSYQDGTFTGQDGSTWNYIQCRGDYEITGKAIMIGRDRTPQSEFYSGNISGGISTLNFDYMQAFTTDVDLEVYINDVLVASVTSSNEQGIIKNSGDISVDIHEDFEIKFINRINSAGQVVVDNISWTCFAEDCSAPTTHASNISVSNITTGSADVSFTEGNGTLRLVIAREGDAVTANPTDQVTYESGDLFGDGAEIEVGQFVVYNGSGNSFTMTGLNGGTTYHLKIFEYKCSDGNENYYTENSPATASFTSSIGGVSQIIVKCIDANQVSLEWNSPPGDYDEIIIGAKQGATPDDLSVDPSSLNADQTFGSGSIYGTNSYIVYKGSANGVTVSGLNNPPYTFRAYTYKSTNWSSQTAEVSYSNPNVADVYNLSATAQNGQVTLDWNNPDAGCYDEIIIVAHTAAISGTPTEAYIANSNSYTDVLNPNFPDGGKVVYNGAVTPQTITNLTNDTYHFKVLVRKGANWSDGVSITATPNNITILDYGDLAIIAVNAQLEDEEDLGSVGASTGPDEIAFVMFKDFTSGSSIDLTDNGYSRVDEGYWGTTEGVIRITRTGGTVVAGTVIRLRGCNGATNPQWEEHFNIYTGGAPDNLNWTISSQNGNTNFNLTTSNNGDQVWIMQGGEWDATQGQHKGTYSGKVLYGWTPSGWAAIAGYNSTDRSCLFPGADCSNTNLNGVANKYKVKYTGPIGEATPREWLARIGDVSNWTGYEDNDDYFDGGSIENSISIKPSAFEGNYWIGSSSADWFDCRNWGTLRVPDQTVNVTFPSGTGIAERNLIIDGGHATCNSFTIQNHPTFTVSVSGETTKLSIFGNLEIASGVIFTHNAGEILIYRNWTNNGSFNPGSGKVTFCGTANQSINRTSGEERFNILKSDKTAGAITLDSNIILNSIEFLQGKIITNDNHVNVSNDDPNAITGYGISTYIQGNLRRDVINGNNYVFPVGTASLYQRTDITVNSSTGLTYIDASFHTDNFGSLDITSLGLAVDGTPLQTLLDAGYWTINPNAGVTAVNYDIGLFLRGATNMGAEPGQHTVITRDDNTSDWTLRGEHNNNTQSITGDMIFAKRTASTQFSDFAIAKHNEFILPVEMLYFDLDCKIGINHLSWATASETNSDYFEIQKSFDGLRWNNIGMANAAGFSNSLIRYSFEDRNTNSAEFVYYRLKQFDFDGSYYYSKIIGNVCENEDNISISLYPNPCEASLFVLIENSTNRYFNIEITDISGRIVYRSKINTPDSFIQTEIITERLKPGMYFISFTSENSSIVKRFERK